MRKISPQSLTKFYTAIFRRGPLVPDNAEHQPQVPVFDLRRIEAAAKAYEQRLKRVGWFLPPWWPLAEADPRCSAPHYPKDRRRAEPHFSQTGQQFPTHLTGERSSQLTPQHRPKGPVCSTYCYLTGRNVRPVDNCHRATPHAGSRLARDGERASQSPAASRPIAVRGVSITRAPSCCAGLRGVVGRDYDRPTVAINPFDRCDLWSLEKHPVVVVPLRARIGLVRDMSILSCASVSFSQSGMWPHSGRFWNS